MQKIRLLLVIFALGLFLAGGLWLGFKAQQFLSGRKTFYSTATVVKQVQTLSQLVTVQYVMEKVIPYEDKEWYPGGESRVLMIAHGIVKAGVDFQKLKPEDIKLADKKIQIRLPKPLVTDCYLDERQTQIIERTTGLLRTFDKNMEQVARLRATQEIRIGAVDAGILKDADERARAQLEKFFQQMGFEVEVLAR